MDTNTLTLIPQIIDSIKDLRYLSLWQKISLILYSAGAGTATWEMSHHDIMYTAIATLTFFCTHVHMLLSQSPSQSDAKTVAKADAEIKAIGTTNAGKSTDDILSNYINEMSKGK